MERRRVLAVCGLCTWSLTGCLTGAPIPANGRTGTATSTEPSPGQETPTEDHQGTPPAGNDIAVSAIVVRKAVRYESTLGSGGVLAADGQQYVVATVRTDRDISPADFALETDANSWDPGLPDTAGGRNRSVAGHGGGPVGRSYGGDSDSYLAFAVPSPLSGSNPRIRYTGDDKDEWPIPDRQRARLGADGARFELRDLSVPESVSEGEPLDVSMTARNVSETDGRFLAAVYWPTREVADDDESHVVENRAEPGRELTVSVSIDTSHTTRETDDVRLSVRGHVSAERDLEVRTDATPTDRQR